MYVSLIGGLGNQLFQLAHALSKSPNKKPYLVSGFSHSRENHEGLPEIFSFSTNEHCFHIQKKPNIWQTRVHNVLIRLSVQKHPSVVSKLLIGFGSTLLSILIYKRFERNLINTEVARGVDFHDLTPTDKNTLEIGYFQSSKYLGQKQVIEKMKSLKLRKTSVALVELQALSQKETPLIVHVRLGDYKKEKNIGLLDQNYYQRVLEVAWNDTEFKKIWVFSDEIELAKSYLPLEYKEHIRWIQSVDNSPSMTFEAMRYGKGYVIANSTFGWWAAALSYNDSPIVYCPSPWYAGQHSPDEIIPQNWHTIPRA